jgi:hypothetical protein
MSTFEDVYLFKAFLVLFSLLLFGLIATLPLYWLAFIERSVYLENIALENEERKKSVIIINGNHRPMRFLDKELYSKRIEWGVALNQYIPVELYGRGWDKFLSRSLFWITYLKNYFQIQGYLDFFCLMGNNEVDF